MILQHYEFAVDGRDGLVYDGDADFGFSHPDALGQQVGIRDASPYQLSAGDRQGRVVRVPKAAAFPGFALANGRSGRCVVFGGGPHSQGIVRGSTRVDRDAWFFKAHFLDDPVWPGSLGLEAVLQLFENRGDESLCCSSNLRFRSRRAWATPTAGPIAGRSSRRTSV